MPAVSCPYCGSSDLKADVVPAGESNNEFDYGCRGCLRVFDC